ncbi:flippase [Heyndrickxia coagulans]|uniref:flippase n=1 Tax=Heyndrickxia coagulans TaxID=1398 RepID=UPI002E23B653|nr:flippase [Heyndrickxia coagulans]
MSIAKNYIYNVIYQIVTLIVPLITVPYISRVLGSNGVGISAYTYSIIQYFVLLGTIGITLYGNRAIAYVRDDKNKLSETFWGIFSLQVITTLIAFLIFILFLKFSGTYQNIFLLQSFYLFAAMFDVSWLFMGIEDFKKTVTRNLFVKIFGVICVFIFVQTSSDLWKYVLILSLSQFLGNLTLWLYIPKTVNKFKVTWKQIKNHLMPSVSLFIPQIAIQIYVVLNKTMLGYMSNTNEVGFFDNSDKIVKMVLSVVTAMGIVMLPRVSNTFAKGDMKKVNDYLYRSFDFSSYLSILMMFGLMGIAGAFTPWFFGPGFSKTGLLISIISPIIVLVAWSNVIGQQYMMPVGKVRGFTLSVTAGAIVNFILNLLLIPYFKSTGTAISTVVAEFTVTFVQLFILFGHVQYKKLFFPIWKYVVSGSIMFIIIKYIGIKLGNGIETTVIQVILGMIIYFIILFLLRSEMNQYLFRKAIKMVRRGNF